MKANPLKPYAILATPNKTTKKPYWISLFGILQEYSSPEDAAKDLESLEKHKDAWYWHATFEVVLIKDHPAIRVVNN